MIYQVVLAESSSKFLVYYSADFPSDLNISTPDSWSTLPQQGVNPIVLFHLGITKGAGTFLGKDELLHLLCQQGVGGGGDLVQAGGEAQEFACCTLSVYRVN